MCDKQDNRQTGGQGTEASYAVKCYENLTTEACRRDRSRCSNRCTSPLSYSTMPWLCGVSSSESGKNKHQTCGHDEILASMIVRFPREKQSR